MDAHALKSALEHAVLWICGLGLAAIALGWCGWGICRIPGRMKAAARRYGWAGVAAFLVFAGFATINGFPTNEEKHQGTQQDGLVDSRQDGDTSGDPDLDSDSDESGSSGIMTLELGDDDYGTDDLGDATGGIGSDDTEALSLPAVRPISESDYAAGIVLARIGTNETWSFDAPAGAELLTDWLQFGAAQDWVRIGNREEGIVNSYGRFSFLLGTNRCDALTVFSYGTARPSMTNRTTFVSPFQASLGIVPVANWEQLAATDRPSQFWQYLTPSNTFVMTWQNVLLDRASDRPVSFQAEFEENGDVMFRYDLSRLADDLVTNLVVGISNDGVGRVFNALSRGTTSLKWVHLDPTRAGETDPDGDGLSTDEEVLVYHTDPYRADTDMDGLSDGQEVDEHGTDPLDPHSIDPRYPDGVAVVLGDVDPFSYPEGSTNTVWEHVFYTGTTNAPFAYPQSTDGTAVLRVTVSGSGSGELIVGDQVVPLLGSSTPAPARAAARGARSGDVLTGNTLFLTVGKGERKVLWFRKPGGLDVAIESEDLLIGELPIVALRRGWIAFPHTEATIPCIHDLDSCSREVALVHGEEFPGLTATWESEAQGVTIANDPPVSAKLYGSFRKSETRLISYRVWHPDILNSDTNIVFSQTLRFCPQLSDEENVAMGGRDDDSEDDPLYQCRCADGEECSCCSGEWCHCAFWGCTCNAGREDTVSTNDVEAVEAYTNMMDSATLADANNILYLCRDYRKGIDLAVPRESVRQCCPCPEHHAGNCASVVSCSRRLEIQHLDGSRFVNTNADCTVYAEGLSPSRAPNDASVYFMTNGVVNRTSSFTVLGVGFSAPDSEVPLARYNELSEELGYPVVVCTNLERAARLTVRTEVLLTNGVVRLALTNATGKVEVWTPEWWDNNSNYHSPELLLRSGDLARRHFSMAQWRGLLRRHGRTTDLDVRVVGLEEGHVDLVVDFVSAYGSLRIRDTASQRVTIIPPPLLPDYNRDGVVDKKDVLRWSSDRPAYFWSNDDAWRGDDAFLYGTGFFTFSSPDSLNNGTDEVVNGHNDYVNMLPLRLDLSGILSAWGSGDLVYEFTTQAPGSVRFLPVRTKWNSIGQFAKAEQYLVSGEPITNAGFVVTSRHRGGAEIPYEIPSSLLDLGAANAGALACEFVRRGLLELAIRVRERESKRVLLETRVRVNICDVHRMYRWINLMGECDPIIPDLPLDSKFNTRTEEPDWPDSEHGDANVVFAHGYNMHPEEAWGWSQALFKRLWWSGMDAGFTAVLWRGNNSQVWIPGKQTYATANYHNNVFNAFKTAGAFAREVNALWGDRKYMIAHSLGNMLVSAARQYHGLEYERYFMLNAAVPIEAYDPVGGVTDDSKYRMTPAAWRGYPDAYRSTHWHDLFDASDARSTLTWSNRFSNVDRTINFYSSRDEVIQNGDGGWKQPISREFAWYNQERAKGGRLVSQSPQAGWGFGDHYRVRYVKRHVQGRPVYGYRPCTLAELNDANVTAEDFKTGPLFRDFSSSEVYGANGSDFILDNDEFYWETLAYGIPAESLATGANVVPAWEPVDDGDAVQVEAVIDERNVNMATKCNPKGEKVDPLDWIHSYFIQRSLFETKILYRRIVDNIEGSRTGESL